MRKLLIFICIIATLCSTLVSCGVKKPSEDGGSVTPPATKTNEELIEERITSFLTAYNSGDMEATMACLTAKNRNEMQALLDLLGGLLGSLTGFSIDLSDLFSLGVAMEADDYMKLKIKKIEIENTLSAVATATMDLADEGEETIYFIMAYENGGWYIEDMTDKTASDDSESTSSPLDDIDTAFLNERTESQGLSYRLSDDNSYYILDGFGSCQDTHIVVPEYPVEYNDIPVKEVSLVVYSNTIDIEYITIPKTVSSLRISAPNLKAIHYLGDLEDFFNVESKISGPRNGLGNYNWAKTALYTNGVILKGELKIPASVEKIHSMNFPGYQYITSLVLEGNTQIGASAFSYCWGLTSVNLENFNGNIENNAFYYCTSLKEIDFGDSKATIGPCAFEKCTSLNDISGGESLQMIYANSFSYTAYEEDESNWEKGALYINNWLYGTKEDVINLDIREGTVGIAASHYDRTTYATYVPIRSNVATINIPVSLTHIGNGAFDLADTLHAIKYGGTAEQWETIVIGTDNEKLSDLKNAIVSSQTKMPLYAQVFMFEGHTYTILSGPCTWKEAKAFCESLGGHLATLTSAEENHAIYNFMSSQGIYQAYFGLSDAEEEGIWKWVTGEALDFNNWESNQPDNYREADDYGQFFKTSEKWNDDIGQKIYAASGRANISFICEWDNVA